mgnify:FL=1
MCGIAGWVSWDGQSHLDEVAQMARAAVHRGPDAGGLYSRDGVTLGHRRLSILDLSERGAQPMTRGGATITYNGEIYNYLEVRRELERLGHDFDSSSDTEVLLAAYLEWGEACVRHFDGMWAFAIHDSESNTVYCSRDRFGEKPFVYAHLGKDLVFASEVRQLLAVGCGKEPNFESLREFVAFGGKLLTESTFFAEIQNLQPGSNMVIDLSSGVTRHSTYYRPGHEGIFTDISASDVDAHFAEEFERSVITRLRSDVPIGVLLSGGVDSSLIAAVAGPAYEEVTGNRMFAVTSSSGDDRNDEASRAADFAQTMNLDWHVVPARGEEDLESWRLATRIIEQPMASASHLMQMRAMQRLKELGCTVILDGQGADESWLGYPRYAVGALSEMPLRARPAFALQSANRTGLGIGRWMAQLAYFGIPDVAAARVTYRMRTAGIDFDHRQVRRFIVDGVQTRGSSSTTLQGRDVHGEQLAALLRYADRTSMHFSVEDRLPFLDYRLVELALSVPFMVKSRTGWPKWPLRKRLSDLGAPEVAWRKGKIGFEPPQVNFDATSPANLATIQHSRIARELMSGRTRRSRIDGRTVWRLFSIAMWEDAFFSG